MKIKRLEKENLYPMSQIRNKHIKYLRQFTPLNMQDQEKWFESTNDLYWSILDDKKINLIYEFDETIGAIGLTQIDMVSRKAELSFVVDDYQSLKDYDSVLYEVLEYAFTILNLNKVFCLVYEYDQAKQDLFEKCKWEIEGIDKEDKCMGGVYYNTYRYAIFCKDYLDRRL